MASPVMHFEIWAKNSKKQTAFYKKLLGWKIDAKNPMHYGLVSTGSKRGIGGGIMQNDKGVKPGVTFYVEVKDLQKTLDQARKLGGKVVMKPYKIEGMGISIAMFRDPEGNMIGIMK
jgi:predicted enzyme related to lactoylglutathione lyase